MKAYPFLHKHPTTGETTLSHGMDLRDYFAGLAMQALISSWILRSEYPETDSVVAEHAYQMADNMIEQREKKDE